MEEREGDWDVADGAWGGVPLGELDGEAMAYSQTSLIDVELVFEVEEETRRLASKATRECESEMWCHKKIGDVGSVDFAGDSSVVAGGAWVLEYSAAIGGNPDATEDSGVEGRGGGAKVVNWKKWFGDVQDGG